MVNTELETTTMATNASNPETNPKASLQENTPVKDPAPKINNVEANKPEFKESELHVSNPQSIKFPETAKTEESKVHVSNPESIKTTGAVVRGSDEDETKANPSNQTSPPSDTPHKRIQSTFDDLNDKVVYLVHWENNVHSGAALASILAFLILTAYNSLFNIFCGFALAAIGCDWIFVLATKQFKTIFNQEAANPHEKYLNNPPQIKKEDLNKYIDIWVDIINLSLIEATKIVLIENPLRSMKYVGIFYVIWTIASWFSFHTIAAIGVITAFAVPKFYKHNQELVNKHLDNAKVVGQSYFDRGVDVVTKNTGDVIPKIQKFAASKGWVANSDAAKKQE